MEGEIFVITAPSGTGKTTLLKALLTGDSRLQFSISYTTRPPRSGEVHGQDYFFVTPEEFEGLKARGALVEWVEQFGYYYGTSREWVKETLARGVDLIFDLDSRGAWAIKEDFPQATMIFILPPHPGDLEERLRNRGDLQPEEMARRLRQGRGEVEEVHRFDFLVINDDLTLALAELKAIITAARCRTSRVWPRKAPGFLRD
ncbi:MAG: guanylate kinase [Deltaproteobacteria bacterium]|nr:guanylate kinase [Deltaproteobacteria bacterium]